MTEPKRTRTGRNLPAAIAVGAAAGRPRRADAVHGQGHVPALRRPDRRRRACGSSATRLARARFTCRWSRSWPAASRWSRWPTGPRPRGRWRPSRWRRIGVLAWRLPGGAAGYVRDVTAGVFTLLYLPLAAVFVALMLAEPDGSTACLPLRRADRLQRHRRLPGRHPDRQAPDGPCHQPEEDLGRARRLRSSSAWPAGAVLVPRLLGGHVWQGLLLGLAAVAAATLGDLVESMIKRDLDDQGHGPPAARSRRHHGPARLAAGHGPR